MHKNKILKITEITFRHFGGADERIKAMASVVIENQLVIHEVRIIDGPLRGLFVSYPNKKLDTQDKNSCAHPIDNETRIAWEQQILETFEAAKALGTDRTKGLTFHFQSSKEQKPLTLEQLQTVRPGAPVLVYTVCFDEEGGTLDFDTGAWETFDGLYFHGYRIGDDLQNYGKVFVAFRCKPEVIA